MVIKAFEKRYPHATLRFDEVSIHQRCVGIAGKNGTGKSTYLKSLAGLIQSKPTVTLAQTAYLDHHTWVPDGILTKTYAARLKVLLDVDEGQYTQLYEAFKLSLIDRKKTHECSKGMRQKWLLSLCLASSKTLLLDEPEDGLDTEALAVFIAALKERAAPTFLATHQPQCYETLSMQWIRL
jgi:ABC-type multidrug transport system ATPase subunit